MIGRVALPTALLAAALAAGCASNAPREVAMLGSADVAADFHSYTLKRVGLMPLEGAALDADHAELLQGAFYSELSRSTPFELVPLEESDLEEVQGSDPHRRGWYDPKTVIELAHRYNLDGVLFGVVPHRRDFPPQELSVQMDLVASETGLVVWQASVHLDARDPRVVEGLEVWTAASGESGEAWRVSLQSPARFAGFAAWQVAQLL